MKTRNKTHKRFTITDFNRLYPDEDTCLLEVFINRYGDLKKCPECEKETKFYKVKKRKRFKCKWCGYELHPLAGTIFHKSDTSLKLWFYAIYLFASSKNGVSAKELERQLGVTYKCAWRMAKQIRLLFMDQSTKLKGVVEIDETYYGPTGNTHNNKAIKKPIVGIVQRQGKIKAYVTDNIKGLEVSSLIRDSVRPGSKLMTDESPIYNFINRNDYDHESVHHSRKEWVRGDVHTNSIEGFWGQLKRSISGTHHSVSVKYLPFYVSEYVWKYNSNFSSLHPFASMLLLASKPS